MENRLPLNKLNFGKTDAFNELLEYGDKWFTKSFFMFEKYNIEKFIDGRSYYICGEKGTGKTAMLQYLKCFLSNNPNNLVVPIRFKTDLDSEDKKSIVRAASNAIEEVAENLNDFKDISDAVMVWQVFILNKLFHAYETCGEYHLFEENYDLDTVKKLLKVIYPEYTNTIVPKIKHGKITVSAKISTMLDAKLQLEVGSDKFSSNLSFTRLAKTIIDKFSHLKYNDNKAFILFDELELSMQSKKEHQRDIQLIRDLIIAIDRLNRICKQSGFDIHIVSSIRTEVIKSAYNAGYEINKCIEDFGVTVFWYQKGGNYANNKLLNIIENKIIASEEISGITNHGDIWDKYFPKYINGIETKRYILNYSWMHPRDVVRLMNMVLRQYNGEDKFTQEMFDRALKDYASASWNELQEGLCLKYQANELKIIKQIFTKLEMPFTLKSISSHMRELAEIDVHYESFMRNYNIKDILEDLFDFGVIGNSGQRMVFKFMGDDDLSLTENMIIHTPLRNFFAVKSWSKSENDIYKE